MTKRLDHDDTFVEVTYDHGPRWFRRLIEWALTRSIARQLRRG